MVHTRNSIIRALLEEAVKKRNIAALIFCAKNLCGWSDRNDIQTSEKKAETLKEVPTVTLKAFAREQANKLKEEGARPN